MPMADERILEITMPIKVRTYDIDSAGHVSNIVYFRWLEDMRLELLEKFFPLSSLVALGVTPVIASSSIEYKRPIRLFDKPVGHMWISRIGQASMHFECEIYVQDELTTHAQHKGAFVDLETMRMRRVPDIVIQKFRQAKT